MDTKHNLPVKVFLLLYKPSILLFSIITFKPISWFCFPVFIFYLKIKKKYIISSMKNVYVKGYKHHKIFNKLNINVFIVWRRLVGILRAMQHRVETNILFFPLLWYYFQNIYKYICYGKCDQTSDFSLFLVILCRKEKWTWNLYNPQLATVNVTNILNWDSLLKRCFLINCKPIIYHWYTRYFSQQYFIVENNQFNITLFQINGCDLKYSFGLSLGNKGWHVLSSERPSFKKWIYH